MRILYMTNDFPYPLTTGYLRHYFLIRELSQHHDVTLLSLVRPDFQAEHIDAMSPMTEQVLTFADARTNGSLAGKVVHRVGRMSGRSRPVQEMCGAARELTRAGRFDAVLVSGRETFPALNHLDGLPVVVDLCDAASARLRGTVPYVGLAQKPAMMFNYMHMRRVESRLMRGATHTLFISCRDRDAVLGNSPSRSTIIPNGVDVDFWKRDSTALGKDTIIFTGGMNYPPNTDAALRLIDEILPIVHETLPSAELLIVGRDPTRKLIAAGKADRVTVTGFVDDVRPHLENASVFAAPLRFGAGMQNKVLEAMAMQVPVITTQLVADGLRTEEGDEPPLCIADDARECARRIVRQLIAGRANPALDLAAREYVERHFCWHRSGRKLEEVIETVYGGTKGQVAACSP